MLAKPLKYYFKNGILFEVKRTRGDVKSVPNGLLAVEVRGG